ncbi:MAG: hypothetical protein Q8Q29_02630 [Actinomycetota bacterium]|nr:hypothetical protein [Actinomycetota bacterium]
MMDDEQIEMLNRVSLKVDVEADRVVDAIRVGVQEAVGALPHALTLAEKQAKVRELLNATRELVDDVVPDLSDDVMVGGDAKTQAMMSRMVLMSQVFQELSQPRYDRLPMDYQRSMDQAIGWLHDYVRGHLSQTAEAGR